MLPPDVLAVDVFPPFETMSNMHQHLFSNLDTSTLSISAKAVAVDAVDAAVDDGGWWQSYLNVFKTLLIFIHSKVNGPLNYIGIENTWGPSIFLFTAGVRSLLLPLSIQQTKGSEYMKVLKPYQDQIKEKYKDNKDMQNRASAKLFEDAKTNPLNGCLVSLAQIPIFLALYRSVTLLAKDGVLDESFLWIPSLQGPVTAPTYRGLEWLTQNWTPATNDGASFLSSIPTPSLGWETSLAFCIMPVILVLGQALSMSVLTPPPDESLKGEEKETAERTAGILKFLPLLIGFFSLQVPAGLTIYWFTSNFFTLGQSVGVRQYFKMNPPDIELPDYWDALSNEEDLTPAEKREAAKAGMNVGPTWQDILDEAKFHYTVDRAPIREGSPAWDRVLLSSDKGVIPDSMLSWVESSHNSEHDISTSSTANGVLRPDDEQQQQTDRTEAESVTAK